MKALFFAIPQDAAEISDEEMALFGSPIKDLESVLDSCISNIAAQAG